MKAWLAALWLSFSPAAEPPSTPSLCYKNCTVSEAGEKFIQSFEGFIPFVYKDVAGKNTIGFGHLVTPGEKFNQPLLPEEAAKLMKKDLRRTEAGINPKIAISLKQGQYDALASFAFNMGVGALSSSTLLKRVNAGQHELVPAQFMRWINAGNPLRPVNGLIRRREAEAGLYSV